MLFEERFPCLGGGLTMAARIPSPAMDARAPCSTAGPGTGAALEASCPVSMSLEASRAPTPPPHWMLYSAGCACWEGGCEDLMSELCPHVLCFPSSCAHIWSVSCSLLVLLIISQVPGVCHSLVYSSEPCVPCV